MKTIPWFLVLVACGANGKDDEEVEPIEVYGCVHIAEGDILDVAATREDARAITVGRSPYRVNLLPSVAGYVSFEPDGADDLTLLVDFAGAAMAVWQGEDRIELTNGAANPNCDEDIPETHTVPVGSGTHWLELGPAFQANVWLMLGR